jgi:hypothetical protein
MTQLTALWLPVLLSSVAVFMVSAVIHMVLPWHKKDIATVPDENGVLNALRPFALAPGEYMVPHCSGPEQMKSPEFREKLNKGPVAMLTVFPNGPFNMGKMLGQWFVMTLVVGFFTAYVAGRALPPGSEYLTVFRIAGTTAFMGYALGLANGSIWFGRAWSTTAKQMIDGMVYGLLTAGMFGWLWPAG